MTKIDDTFDEDGKRAPADVRQLCLKIANQAGKGQWWNAMAYAAELVVVCQNGCHEEIERVAAKKRLPAPKKAESEAKIAADGKPKAKLKKEKKKKKKK